MKYYKPSLFNIFILLFASLFANIVAQTAIFQNLSLMIEIFNKLLIQLRDIVTIKGVWGFKNEFREQKLTFFYFETFYLK